MVKSLVLLLLLYFFGTLCGGTLHDEREFILGVQPRAVTCASCQNLVKYFIDKRKDGVDLDELYVEFEQFCKLIGLGHNQCEGKVLKSVDVFAYTVDNNPDLTSQRLCALLLQNDQTCDKGDNFEWTIDIPNEQRIEKPKPGNTTFKILHITDLHYEPLYTPNKTNTCSDLCCLKTEKDGNATEGTACGYWGEYANTDMPMQTIQEVLRQASTHDYDFVYLTGDYVNHRSWDTNQKSNSETIRELFVKVRETFKDVPVFGTIGNHEPAPADCYAPANVTDDSISTKWLYDLLKEEWSTWLPNGTVHDGGYYTVSPREGFRIIVLNNNVAHTYNWWLVYDDYDPYGQLNWLVKVLTEAEEKGEIVHILQHIPTGYSGLLTVWVREYKRIIERFSNTIAAQFNGHTHQDEFIVYYNSTNSTQPINVAINGGSVISDYANPNYKLYEVDDTSYAVMDSEVWTFNLTLANEYPDETPEWYKLYSFREAYGLVSLEPKEMDDLVHRMAASRHLIKQFHAFRHRYGGSSYLEGCDKSCQKKALCSTVVSQYGEKTQCKALLEIYDGNN